MFVDNNDIKEIIVGLLMNVDYCLVYLVCVVFFVNGYSNNGGNFMYLVVVVFNWKVGS